VAGWLLLRRRDRLPLLVALVLAAASTAAVVLSVYVRVPAVGPLPGAVRAGLVPREGGGRRRGSAGRGARRLLLRRSRSTALP
jgi:hypothetical protein